MFKKIIKKPAFFFIEGKKPQKGTLELPPTFELPLPHKVARFRGWGLSYAGWAILIFDLCWVSRHWRNNAGYIL